MNYHLKNWLRCKTVLSAFVYIMALIFPILVLADAYTPREKIISIPIDNRSAIILKDKSETYYEIFREGDLKHGVSSSAYRIRKIDTSKYFTLIGGVEDGESGGCNRSESLGIDIATTDLVLEIKKIDRDNYFDIFTSYIEENCKTGQKEKITKMFYATENGFEEGNFK